MGLFIHINSTCHNAAEGKIAVVVPKKDPSNYRLMHLTDIVAKKYARFLLRRVESWVADKYCTFLQKNKLVSGTVNPLLLCLEPSDY